MIAWGISAHFNIFELIYAFSRRYQDWQLDEVFTLLLFLSMSAFGASFIQSRQHLRQRGIAEREAFFAARQDVLTGLPNRRMFLELAGKALGEAWREGERCSVLFVDLDGFKPVNDTHGHAVGDALLIEVAATLRQCCPEPALVARLGGDEFVLLLPPAQAAEAPIAAAERILRKLREPFSVAGRVVTVGATIGIASGPENGRRADDLLHAADLAMYHAKRTGRGTIHVYQAGAADPAAASAKQAIEPKPDRRIFTPILAATVEPA